MAGVVAMQGFGSLAASIIYMVAIAACKTSILNNPEGRPHPRPHVENHPQYRHSSCPRGSLLSPNDPRISEVHLGC